MVIKVDIWLINHYAVPPKYYPLARQTYFAKHLMAQGHTVTIFAASTVHNSNQNLITNGERWREETVDGVRYVYIKCLGYQGNGLRRVYNICEFAWKLPSVCKNFPRPDAIVATSMPPTSCAMGIHLARRYHCRGVAEVADLWPESLVALGVAGPHNPAVIALRFLEKWIYIKSDALVFTMEGAYDYIVERGWQKNVPRNKVHYINNGVDLDTFQYNRDHFQTEDPDLDDPNTFKLVYTGSIRKANGLAQLIDCAELLRDEQQIRFLIYGSGDDLDALREICQKKKLDNIRFKGRVEKKYVPYILSKSDVTLLNYAPEVNAVYRFGNSQNKLFEYLAAGKPVLTNVKIFYNPADRRHCCFTAASVSAEDYAKAVLELYKLSPEDYKAACQGALETAEEYDFKNLTQKLLCILEGRPASAAAPCAENTIKVLRTSVRNTRWVNPSAARNQRPARLNRRRSNPAVLLLRKGAAA